MSETTELTREEIIEQWEADFIDEDTTRLGFNIARAEFIRDLDDE